MLRDEPTTTPNFTKPLVTQLTSEQIRNLPASTPAPPPVFAPSPVAAPPSPAVMMPVVSAVEPARGHETLLPGRTLRDEMTRRMQKDQRFHVEEVRRLGQQLCHAIRKRPAEAMSRRIRPESVSWSETGVIGLCDEEAPASSSLLPCERDDQRDVAAILFELLTGSVPREPLVGPHELRKNVPTRMSQAVLRALAVKPEQRFPSLEEFQKQLAMPSTKQQERLEMAAILGVALLVSVGLTWWAVTRPKPKPEDKIEYTQRFVLVDEARKRAEQVDADIVTEAKRTSDDIGRVARGAEAKLTNSIGMELVLIPAGEFEMGSNEREDEKPVHRVRISQPFYLGVYEVTQSQYERVMGRNPSWFSRTGGGKEQVSGLDTSESPVEQVSWNDAQEFCRKLSSRSGESGRRYRLPTEAEWEYACRAGTKTKFHFGDVLNGDKANVDGTNPEGTTTKGPFLKRTTSVGRYVANGFGLYDMHGNVWEWCEDWYDKNYYAKSPPEDPKGADPGSSRVIRGGGWYYSAVHCRAAFRYAGTPSNRDGNLGFRVVRVVE